MKYSSPLAMGRLVRRYKRFLADIQLGDGREVTIHCPNTGSMKNCADPGDEVWFSTSDNPGRKYARTWELSRTSRGHYIGINTGRANQLVAEAIRGNVISELEGYEALKTEVRYGQENSRVDIVLSGHQSRPECFVEVKSVTLLESPLRKGIGFFPDAVSTRGTKHLRELMDVVSQGGRGVLFFCVQHSGIRAVRPAAHIDPEYAATLLEAARSGVEVIAYKARMSPSSIAVWRAVPVLLP